jgi:sterol desaturase/sphingolipid hydroxylase (fatty acid hydroxylase superfamily)
MHFLQYLLLIFVVVQSAFIILDLVALVRQHQLTSVWNLIKNYRASFSFLACIWIVYVLIEMMLFAVFPSFETIVIVISQALEISPMNLLAASSQPTSPWVIGYLLAAIWIIAGFWDYVFHRWMLHSRSFWFLHENHHLPTQVFTGMPGITIRPFLAPSTFLVNACTAIILLGWVKLFHDPSILIVLLKYLPVLVLAYVLVGSASHSVFLRQFDGARISMKFMFIVTPQEHILHHGVGLKGNYGNFMTLWDHVFGTYLDPIKIDHKQVQLGLDYDQDFLGAITANRLKIPQHLREKHRLGAFSLLLPIGEKPILKEANSERSKHQNTIKRQN